MTGKIYFFGIFEIPFFFAFEFFGEFQKKSSLCFFRRLKKAFWAHLKLFIHNLTPIFIVLRFEERLVTRNKIFWGNVVKKHFCVF